MKDIKLTGRIVKLRQEVNYWSYLNSEVAGGVEKLWWRDVVKDFRVLEKDQLASGVVAGVQYKTFCINTPVFLKALYDEIITSGGSCIRLELPLERGLPAVLDAAREAAKIGPVEAFVNALGLAAGRLCADESVFPVKGQTTLVKGEASVIKAQMWKDKVAFAIPRPGTGLTLLVGSKDADNWS
jgi:D-amino-acid oxidase